MSLPRFLIHGLTCCLESGADLLILKTLSFVLVKHQEDILWRDLKKETIKLNRTAIKTQTHCLTKREVAT